MKKILPIASIICFALMCTSSATTLSGDAPTIILNGNTHYVGGSGPGNYTTITEAIQNATDGDIIYVYNGTYKETITLEKQLTLIGHDTPTTRIQSNSTTISITADHCTITHFTIAGGSRGIHLTTAQYTTITENHITGCTRGITIEALLVTLTLTNIRDNLFTNNDYGILTRGGLISIYQNKFSDNLRAIDHTGILSNIALNRVENNTDGIKIAGYLNNIARNAINHNSIGILCFGHGNNIHHNNFISNQDNSYLESAFMNRWLNNYWTKPRLAPYPIRGVVPIPGGTEIVYYDFDPFPRIIPNTIPT